MSAFQANRSLIDLAYFSKLKINISLLRCEKGTRQNCEYHPQQEGHSCNGLRTNINKEQICISFKELDIFLKRV